MATFSASAPEFDIATYGLGGTDAEAVALSGGNYVVTWSNTVNSLVPIDGITDVEGSAILARMFGPDGAALGAAFQVNGVEPGFQTAPEIVALGGGGFAIAWSDLDHTTGNDAEAIVRVYGADGTALGDQITLATSSEGDQRIPQLAAAPGGGFLAVWNDERSSAVFDDDLYGQYFDAAGNREGPEFIARDDSDADIIRSGMVVLDDGEIRIHANERLWTSDGTLLPSSITPLLDARSVSSHNTAFYGNFSTAMTAMPDGRYAMAFVDDMPEVGPYAVALRVRDANNFDNAVTPDGASGSLITVSDDIFATAAQNNVGIDVAATADGGLVVVWAFLTPEASGTGGDFNVLAQAFGPDLNRIGDNVLVHSDTADNQSAPFAVQGNDGKILIGWTDDRSDSDGKFATVGRFFSVDEGGSSGVSETGTPGADVMTGTEFADSLDGLDGDDRLLGMGGNDTLLGGDGTDTLNGGDGDDLIRGGATEADRRDVIYGGAGNDSIDAGHGNDEVFGQGGNDTIAGGFGADTLQGQDGDDVITGSAFGDIVFGNAGDDFVNGGFGHDLINGGTGADKFFHTGGTAEQMEGHGSDWVQDYNSAEGDVLVFGGSATASQFQVNLSHTENRDTGERSGDDDVQEAFVIYKPTGQILWALVDGGGQASINLQIGGDVFDLLG